MVAISRHELLRLHDDCMAFLTREPVLLASGQVLSWANSAHSGFVYPEAMGLYLTAMSQTAARRDDAAIADAVHKVAAALQREVTERGGVGINGKLYLFDTCMALTGLLSYRKHLRGAVDTGAVRRMASFIVEMADSRIAVAD